MTKENTVTIDERELRTVLNKIETLKKEVLEKDETISKLRSNTLSTSPKQRVEVGTLATMRRQEFKIGDTTGRIMAGEYEDGNLGEIYLIIGKEGSLVRGLCDALAISVSLAIQYGTPIKAITKTFRGFDFFPNGAVSGDPNIKGALSIIDYVAKWIEFHYVYHKKEKQETKKEAIIKKLDENIEEKEVFDLCPSCGEKSLKLKAMGCSDRCADCGFIREGENGCPS